MPGRPNTPNRSASLKETILLRQLPLMASTWIACARYTPVVSARVGGEPGRAVGGRCRITERVRQIDREDWDSVTTADEPAGGPPWYGLTR
jgi:hypothetical protein